MLIEQIEIESLSSSSLDDFTIPEMKKRFSRTARTYCSFIRFLHSKILFLCLKSEKARVFNASSILLV